MKKTVNPLGTFLSKKKDKPVEFICDRCLDTKKSKNVVEWKTIEQETKKICNGCYGYLLSTLSANKYTLTKPITTKYWMKEGERITEDVIVDYYEVDGGWICFKVKAGEQIFDGRFSEVFDPLLDFKKWLEAIAIGVQQTSFEFGSSSILGNHI